MMAKIIKETYVKPIFIFSLIGTLFSGYLSVGKIISGACPLYGECPSFLGYPACYYGLVMFLALLITSSFLLFKKLDYPQTTLIKIILFVSFIGILFSGYFSIEEIFYPICPEGICDYALLLPTCVYGLFMYVVIFVISLLALYKKRDL
jgi:hypothetical protein